VYHSVKYRVEFPVLKAFPQLLRDNGMRNRIARCTQRTGAIEL
jgi:hypothetical protein